MLGVSEKRGGAFLQKRDALAIFVAMQRYFMYFSYDGTSYHGWQVQPGAVTVQQVLQEALSTILRHPVELVGAGRTDAGVHAARMVAHFDLPDAPEGGAGTPEALAAMAARLNRFLPHDIAVERICPVVPEAHARFSALSRTYQYFMSRRKSPFSRAYCYYYAAPLDVEAMNHAAGMLLGYRDFTSFSKLHTDVKTNNCHVRRAFWQGEEPGKLVFTIEADRFLRNMVRAVVGTLLDVGRGKMPPGAITRILDEKDRRAAGNSAPACGLFLMDVAYPDDVFPRTNRMQNP